MTPWQLWLVTLALLLVAAGLLWKSAQHQSERALGGDSLTAHRKRLPRDSLQEVVLDYLLAAGIHLGGRGLLLLGGLLLVMILGTLLMFGNRLGALLVLGGLVAINVGLGLRAQHLRQKIRDQLPNFMEQVVREIGVGATLEIAFRRNVERVPLPLRDALSRIAIRRELGMELHEGLRREAQLLKIHEFDLLAAAVEVNQVHGGSLKEILGSFVELLRQQERGRRELKALTGETRVTAVVLAGMPLALAGFMVINNPEFLAPMLESPSGKLALWVALGLELGGCFALWRMLRSV
ncbi:type II secretion system F family protein [Bisbaumannia pacifica]|uniref:Type II secretion system F family protein n=1 Tax=Bisbaumannia pacifica TaxID=77098 RepID=A0ABD4L6W1_9GAMM|nr:type II secretion system F family protein [Halomonas pacifica]MBH8581508.1 type II secretion system F family protein [Halomonas pacifica]